MVWRLFALRSTSCLEEYYLILDWEEGISLSSRLAIPPTISFRSHPFMINCDGDLFLEALMPEIHQPAIPDEKSDPVAERHNARLGMALFLIYLLAYAAFVMANALWPETMTETSILDLNRAVAWGLGLILGAFALSLIYAMLCIKPAKEQV